MEWNNRRQTPSRSTWRASMSTQGPRLLSHLSETKAIQNAWATGTFSPLSFPALFGDLPKRPSWNGDIRCQNKPAASFTQCHRLLVPVAFGGRKGWMGGEKRGRWVAETGSCQAPGLPRVGLRSGDGRSSSQTEGGGMIALMFRCSGALYHTKLPFYDILWSPQRRWIFIKVKVRSGTYYGTKN